MAQEFTQQVLFKREARRQISRLKNLTWCFDALQAAHAHSGLLKEYINEKSEWALSAFSRSLISEYAKPFVSSRNLDSRRGVSTKFLTKHEDFSSEVHAKLIELRNTVVAHSDADFEGQDVQILTARFVSSPQRKSEVSAVYLPVQVFSNSRSFWYLKGEDTAAEIDDHCATCVSITRAELRAAVAEMQELLVQNARWANELDSSFVYTTDDRNTAEGFTQGVISVADEQRELRIGLANIQQRVTQFEQTLGEDGEWDCEGYRVSRKSVDGKIEYLVTFHEADS